MNGTATLIRLNSAKLALVVVGLLSALASADATDYYWTNATAAAFWTNSAWNPLGYPGTNAAGATDAMIYTSALNQTITVNISPLLSDAYFRQTANTATLSINSGNTLTFTNSLWVGDLQSSTGSLAIILTGTLAVTNAGGTAQFIIGGAGRGTFTAAAAAAAGGATPNLVADTIIVGYTNPASYSSGTLKQTVGGSLIKVRTDLVVGKSGNGTFTMSGTSVTNMVYRNLVVGEQTTGKGSVQISDANALLTVTNGGTGLVVVGAQGTGSVTLSAGTLLADNLLVATNAGSAGSFTWTAGNLTVGGISDPSTLFGNILATSGNGGTLTAAQWGSNSFQALTFGVGAVTNNFYNGLVLGYETGGTGSLSVAGGVIAVTNAGGNAQLIVGQNGGGSYALNSGTLLVNQLLVTNNTPAATNSFFTFAGGTLTTSNNNGIAANLLLASNATFNINGTWNMMAGTNLIAQTVYGGSTKTGTVVVGSGVTNAAVAVVTNATWNLGALNLTIGSGAATGTVLTVNGGTVTNVYTLTLGASGTSFGNSLIVSNGGQVLLSFQLVQNTAGASNNTVLVTGTGSVFQVVGTTFGGASAGNQLIVSNGAQFISTGNIHFADQTAAANNNSIVVTGPGSVLTNTALMIIGGGAAGTGTTNVTITVSNGGLWVSGGLVSFAGSGGNTFPTNEAIFVTGTGSVFRTDAGLTSYTGVSNSVTVANSATWWNTAGAVTIGAGGTALGTSAYSTVTVVGPGSSWTNSSANAVTISTGNNNQFANGVTISNGATYAGKSAFIIGSAAGSSNNFLTIGGDITSTFSNNALVTVGAAGAAFDTLTVTNANIWTSGLYLGNASSNNTVTVQSTVTWDMLNGQLTFGFGTGNTLVMDSTATMTNVGGIGLLGSGLQFNLTNNILMGAGGAVTTSRVYLVGGSLTLGSTGFGNNSLTLSNQTYTGGGTSIVGSGSSNNVLTILTNTVWNSGAQTLNIGQNAATGNVMVINGGIVTNLNPAPGSPSYVGNGVGANGNSLTISNGGVFLSGSLNIGYNGGSNNAYNVGGLGAPSVASNIYLWIGNRAAFNTMTVTNATLINSGAIGIGYGGSSNTVTILTNGTVNMLGNPFYVGYVFNSVTPATGNVLVVNGGVITNLSSLIIGTGDGTRLAIGNSLTISNGGKFFGGAVTIGQTSGNSNNAYNVGGLGLASTVSNGMIIVGTNSAGFNQMTVTNATLLSGATTIGFGSSNNTVTVNGTNTTWNLLGSALTIGTGAASNNQLIVNAGTLSIGGALTATVLSNTVTFRNGWINANQTIYSNSQVFTIGNATNTAVFNVSSNAVSSFQNGLLVASNAWLTGIGTINASAATAVTATNGAIFSPGLGATGIGTLRVNNFNWLDGAIYRAQITNFTSSAAAPGLNWDLLAVSGTLTNANLNNNRFVIAIDTNSATAPVNFNPASTYSLPIAAFGGAAGYNDTQFSINPGGLGTPANWKTIETATGLYLTYDSAAPTPSYIWTNTVNDAWSYGSAWSNAPAGGNAPPPSGGSNTTVLQFNASGPTAYVATNNFGPEAYTNNVIVLNSGSTATQTLAGAGLIFSGSLNPAGLYQENGGAFIISNAIALGTNTVTFRGPGLGTIIFASNITGTAQINKTGPWNLVLQGSNTFVGPVLLYDTGAGGGTLTLANTSAIGTNSLTVSNGTVYAPITYAVGNGWSNQAVLFSGSSSIWTNTGAFIIGSGTATGNTVTVDNGADLFASPLMVGTNGAVGNTLTITNNGALLSYGTSTIGYNASTNTVKVVGNGVAGVTSLWNLAGSTLYLGSGATTGNVLRIDGGGVNPGAVVSNVSTVMVGTNGAVNNSLIITNGGRLLTTNTASTIGFFSTNNTALIVGGTAGVTSLWNNGNQALTIGLGLISVSNTLTVDGGGVFGSAVLTNVNGLTVGNNINQLAAPFTFGNTLTVTNGGAVFFTGQLQVGGPVSQSANSNLVKVVGNADGSVLSIATGSGAGVYIGALGANCNSNALLIGLGGIVTNVSSVSALGYASALIITNGGKLFTTGGAASSIAGGNGDSFVTGKVSGVNSLWNVGGGIINDVGGSGVLVIENGGVLTNVGTLDISSTWGGANPVNQTIVSNGSLFAQNITVYYKAANPFPAQTGNQLIISGSSTVTVSTALIVTNPTAGNGVTFNGGVLNVASTVYSNTVFIVGSNGTSAATLNLTSPTGTHIFQNGLLVNSNATLTGVGTINAASTTAVTLTNGATLAPGLGVGNVGSLTLNNTLNWLGGGIYQVDLTNFTAGAVNGVNWDFLTINGALSNTYWNNNNFVVNLNVNNAVGYNPNTNYTIQIANFTGSGGFNPSQFTVTTNGALFGGLPYNPNWTVAETAAGLYLVQVNSPYQFGGSSWVWTNAVSAPWSTTTAWTNSPNIPPTNGGNNVVLQFYATNSTPGYSFIATNDITTSGTAGVYTNNKIVFNSTSSGTSVLSGATLTFASDGQVINTAGIYQVNSGGFIISNAVVLATNVVFDGLGAGQVTLASNITGTGQISLLGAWNAVLSASNSFTGPVLVNGIGQLTLANTWAIGTNSLTVSNGTVYAPINYIVDNGWSNQSVTIVGTNSTFITPFDLQIGGGASTGAVVTLANGAMLMTANVMIGATAGSTGNSFVITNGGEVFSSIAVGAVANATSNALTVLGGGGPAVFNLANVGAAAGASNNTMTVANGGVVTSFFGNSLVVNIGNGAAYNNLVLSNGATIWGTVNIGAGSSAASNNALTVLGGGASTVSVLNVGAAGVGPEQITVTNAALVTYSAVTLGNGSSNVTANVLAGGRWNLGGSNLTIGTGSATGNVLTVDGGGVAGGAMVTNVGALTVGTNNATYNSVIITNGGQIYSGAGYIGFGTGNNTSSNTVLVTGTGSVWSNSALTVGSTGSSNSLTIANGGRVLVANNATIGAGTTGGVIANSNTVWVTGTGSVLTVGGTLTVGYGVTAVQGNSLIISNGGAVNDAYGYLCSQNAVSNTVLVTGSGSTWSNSTNFAFGQPNGGSYGTLTIQNGGAVVLTAGGANLGAFNSVIISGTGSVFNDSGTIALGNSSSVIVSNGGALRTFVNGNEDNNLQQIGNAGSYSTVLVTGPGSTWTNLETSSSSMGIGVNTTIGYNTLTVSNGGSFYLAPSVQSGNQWLDVGCVGSSNGVVITGTGSVVQLINQSYGLFVGRYSYSSNNYVTVSKGGTLYINADTTAAPIIGQNSPSNTVLVTDLGSAWTNLNGLLIGTGAAIGNRLTISNGATYVGNGGIVVGNAAGANSNSLIVIGSNSVSVLTNNGLITVGFGGISNTMAVTNASLWSSGLTIGNTSSVNSVTINAGTTWNMLNSDVNISIGGATGNVLTVNGGIVTNVRVLGVSSNALGSGTLNLNGGALFVTQLLVTNNTGGATATTNSLFNFNGGTLTTSNANAIAANIVIASNTAWNVNGVWNMLGGTNLTVSTAPLAGSSAGTISVGAGVSNAAVNVFSNAIWNVGSNNLVVGSGGGANSATGAVLTINGGQVTNFNTLFVGTGANAAFNSLVLTNGGRLLGELGNATIGYGASSASNNLVLVVGGGGTATSLWDVGANTLTVGDNQSKGNVLRIDGAGVTGGAVVTNFNTLTLGGAATASGNSLIITNGGLLFRASGNSGNTYIGNPGAGNSALVVGGGSGGATSVWNNGGGKGLYIGYGSGANNNSLTIDGNGVAGGALVTNLTLNAVALDVGSLSGGNSLILTNGGWLFTAGNNGPIVGFGGSNNTALVMGGGGAATSLWNVGGVNLVIGSNAAYGNVLRLDGAGVTGGAVVTNVNSLIVGTGAGANNNSVILTNGGQLFVSGADTIGSGGNSNSVTVVGGAVSTLWNLGTNLLTIGTGGATGNVLNVNSGGMVLATNIIVSATGLDYSNQISVAGGSLYVTNAAQTGNLVIGQAGGGLVLVTNGLLVADQLALGAATGGAGTLTVNSQGAAVVTNGALTIGQALGTFGSVILNSNGTLVVGNIATVIGQNGTGSLTMNGGTLTNVTAQSVNVLNSLTLGQNASGTGYFTVAGGAFYVTNSPLPGGVLVVGQNGYGALTLTNTGSLTVNQLLVTNNTASTTNSLFNFAGGTLITTNDGGQIAANILLAPNSTFNINGNWQMLGGTNTLAAAANAGTVIIGNAKNTVLVTVSNNAAWTLNNLALVVGNGAATGDVLTIASTAPVTATNVVVAAGPTATNDAININGGGSLYVTNTTGTGTLAIGQGGYGTVTVTNGLLVADQLTLGAALGGTGTLTVNSGGTAVDTNNALVIGQAAGAFGIVNLNSNGTLVVSSNTVVVGQSGTGTLTLNAGGVLSNIFAGTTNVLGGLTLGQNPGGTGSFAVVTGAALAVTNGTGTGALVVGQSGAGTLTMGGGTLTVNEWLATNGLSSVIVFNAGVLNSATSLVADARALVVGNGSSAATVNLLGGGHVFTDGLIITNHGTVTLANATVNGPVTNRSGGLLSGWGTNTSLLFNQGLTEVTNGTLVLAANVDTATGTINLRNGATLQDGTSAQLILNNTGNLNFYGGTLLAGQITNTALITSVAGGLLSNETINTAGGVINVSGGTLVFTPDLQNQGLIDDGGAAAAIIVSNLTAGTLGAVSNGGAIYLTGGSLTAASLTNSATVGLVSGQGNIYGPVVNQAGATVVATGGSLVLHDAPEQSGFVVVAGGALLNVTPDWDNSPGGVLSNFGGTVNGGTLTNQNLYLGYGTENSTLVNAAGATLAVTNGTFSFNQTVTNAGFITVASNSALNVAQAWVNTGTNTLSGGTVGGSGQFTNSDLVVGNGAIFSVFVNTAAGVLDVTNGTLTVTQAPLNYGLLDVASGSTLSNAVTWSNPGTVFVHNQATLSSASSFVNAPSGLLTNLGGTVVQTSFTNQGRVTTSGGLISNTTATAVLNSGYWEVTAASSLTVTPSLVNAFVGVITNGGTLQVGSDGSGPVSNLGTLVLTNEAATLLSGLVTNTGQLVGSGTVTGQVANVLGGTVTATNGTLYLLTAPVNNSTFAVASTVGSPASLTVSSAWSNAGTILVQTNGTLLTSGLLTNTGLVNLWDGSLVQTGFVNEGRVVANGGLISNLANTAVLNDTNGTLNVVSGSLTVTPTLVNLGSLTNSSLLQVGSSGAGTVSNAGTIALLNGTLLSGLLTNTGTIGGNGTLSGPVLNSGWLSATNGDLILANGLASANAGTLSARGGATVGNLISGVASNLVVDNRGTINLQGGRLFSGDVTNQSGALLTGFGTINGATVLNNGLVLANTAGQALTMSGSFVVNNNTVSVQNAKLVVAAVFTNAGTVSFLNGQGTFTQTVVNNNIWTNSGGSSFTFLGGFSNGPSGYIAAQWNDTFVFSNNFANMVDRSTDLSNSWNTLAAKFLFVGGGTNVSGVGTQYFDVAGYDMLGTNLDANAGDPQTNSFGMAPYTHDVIGYSNNFALGTLELGTNSILTMVDPFPADGHKAGLYLTTLSFDPNALLIISNNVEVYYQQTNGLRGIMFGSDDGSGNVLILGNGSFHQLNIIPEPSILLLLLLGALGIVWYRRTHRRRQAG